MTHHGHRFDGLVLNWRPLVLGLINPQLSSARESRLDQSSPRLVMDTGTGQTVGPQRRSNTLHIVTHQIELVPSVFFGRMQRDFRTRKPENKPAAANINMRKFQHVTEEGAIGFGVAAVDDYVCAGDHDCDSCSLQSNNARQYDMSLTPPLNSMFLRASVVRDRPTRQDNSVLAV